MARVAGIDLPKNKRIDVALEYIYGIGKKNAKEVLAKVEGQIDPATRVKDLTEQQAGLLNTILQKEYKVPNNKPVCLTLSCKKNTKWKANCAVKSRKTFTARLKSAPIGASVTAATCPYAANAPKPTAEPAAAEEKPWVLKPNNF